MANKKQSEFPSATSLDGNETVGLIQAGINKKTVLSSLKSYVLQSVNSTLLSGLSTALSTVVTSADSIQTGIGKLQGQVNYFTTLLSGYAPVLILGRSATAVAVPAVTTEEVLATITIPAGLMSLNGQVIVTALWSYTNSANDKTLKVRFGGTDGISYLSKVVTTTATSQTRTIIRNRNSASNQVGFASGMSSFGETTAAPVTSIINTALETTVVITGQKGTGSESLVLESYTVELIK